MKTSNELYPVSLSMQSADTTWQQYVSTSLNNSLVTAEKGDNQVKQYIINRIGQIRRSVQSFTGLNKDLINSMKTAIVFLKANGYKVNLNHSDPQYWITN